MAMMAITTSSSIRVKPVCFLVFVVRLGLLQCASSKVFRAHDEKIVPPFGGTISQADYCALNMKNCVGTVGSTVTGTL
jgi:hypothetical protein